MKKKLSSLLQQPIFWLAGLIGLMVFLHIGYGWRLGWFFVGIVMGWWFVWVDRLVYVYYLFPHEQLSAQVQFLVRQGRYVQALRTLWKRSFEQVKLITKSILFLLVWLPLAFFVVTSTDSMIGKGLVMGLGWRTIYEFYYWRHRSDVLRHRLFWQLKRPMGDQEMRWFIGIFVVVFVVLMWWV